MKAKALEIAFRAWAIGIGAVAIFGWGFPKKKIVIKEKHRRPR